MASLYICLKVHPLHAPTPTQWSLMFPTIVIVGEHSLNFYNSEEYCNFFLSKSCGLMRHAFGELTWRSRVRNSLDNAFLWEKTIMVSHVRFVHLLVKNLSFIHRFHFKNITLILRPNNKKCAL